MILVPIPARHVDYAWRDGASRLAESCSEECTIEQLKLVIARGERQLVRMDADGTVGWGVFKIDQFPNVRVLHITNLVAHHAHFEQFLDALKAMAQDLGCSRIRCCARKAQSRLFRMKAGFRPVYETLEVSI